MALALDDDARLDGHGGHALVGHQVVALVRAGAAVTAGVPAVGERDLVGRGDGEDVVRRAAAPLRGRRRFGGRLGPGPGGQPGEHEGGRHRGPDLRRPYRGRTARPVTRSSPSGTRSSLHGRPVAVRPRLAASPGCRTPTARCAATASRPLDSGGLRKASRTDVRPAVTRRPRPGHAAFAPRPAPRALSTGPPPGRDRPRPRRICPVPGRDGPIASPPCGSPTCRPRRSWSTERRSTGTWPTMAAVLPGAPAPPPRQGVQVDGPRRPPGRGRAPHVLLRHRPRGRGHGRRRSRRRPPAGQRGPRRPPARRRGRGRDPGHGGGRLGGDDRGRGRRRGARGARSTSTWACPGAAATPPTPGGSPTWPAPAGSRCAG